MTSSSFAFAREQTHRRAEEEAEEQALSFTQKRADEQQENPVIWITRLDDTALSVNADHILTAEATPDTVLTLTTGDRLLVKESVEEIMARFTAQKQRILRGPELIAEGT